MFQKLIAPEPLHLPAVTMEQLRSCAVEFYAYDDVPASEEEIIRRVEDADGVLLSLCTPLSENTLMHCARLKYIGLCCSLYEDESCTCHLPTVRKKGITITGVSDYGDKGVPEFVIARLTDLLHGFGDRMWRERPYELTDIPVGVLGFGATGALVARALKHFDADVSYFCRAPKPEVKDIPYMELGEMLERCDILCSCLNKNVTLLTAEALEKWTGGKILVNTSLSPSWDRVAVKKWVGEGNFLICDSLMALGDPELMTCPNVICAGKFSGGSAQGNLRLGSGVVENVRRYLEKE